MFTPFHIYQVAGRKMLLIKSSINLRLQTMKAKWFQISAPMLTVNSNFVPFTQEYGNFSAVQSFTISGKSLEGPVKVTAPEGFLIRINRKSPYYTPYYNWVKSGYINPSSRIIDTVTIDVVSKAYITGVVRGQIALTSQNMTPLKIWVETEVTTPELDTLVASYVEMTGFTSGLRFISRYAEVSAYGIAYREVGAAEFTYEQLGTTSSSDSFTGTINGLLPEVTYEYFGYIVIDSEVSTGQFRIVQTSDFTYSTSENEVGVDNFTVEVTSIEGYSLVEEYGIEYKKVEDSEWFAQQGGTTLSADNFEISVEDLEIGGEYNYRIYFKLSGISYFQSSQEITLLAPTLDSWTATNVVQIGFTTGALNVVGYEQVTHHGMQYKKAADSVWTSVQKGTTLAANNFSQILTGLEAGVSYNYRAYITIDGNTYYGDTKTVSTSNASLNTTTADNIGPYGFRAGGNTIVGYSYISEYGIAYRKGSAAFTHVSGGTSLGANSFLKSLLGLTPGTIYDYKAYIIISGVYFYGSTKQVATQLL